MCMGMAIGWEQEWEHRGVGWGYTAKKDSACKAMELATHSLGTGESRGFTSFIQSGIYQVPSMCQEGTVGTSKIV